MADFRFKDLTVDNAFDFCEVLAVIGVEQVIGAFDKDEIQQLQESGTDMKEVGIVIAMKVCGILIKNISKASSGTKENPITVPEMVTTAGMEYVKGKYYSWNEKVYLMNRVGMTDGESIILYFSPDTLVGQYFEEV